MTTPTPSDPRSQPNLTEQDSLLAALQEQQQTYRLELEALRRRIDQTRGVMQTLVAGLVIALLVTIGIAGWFAYRQLVQEQLAQRESVQAAEAEATMIEQLEGIEAQLQRQQEQLQTLRGTFPEELEALSSSIQSNQRQLQLLQERIEQLETAPASAERSN